MLLGFGFDLSPGHPIDSIAPADVSLVLSRRPNHRSFYSDVSLRIVANHRRFANSHKKHFMTY